MRTNYFANCTTLEELKKEYHKLILKYHPDRGGDHETMVKINLQYEEYFEKLKDIHKTKDGKTYTKRTNEMPSEFRDMLEKLIKMAGIHIEVIGSFIWGSGDTKPHKDALKALKFRWHTGKKCWYKAPADYVKRTKTKYSMDEVRNMFGVQYETDGKESEKYKMITV